MSLEKLTTFENSFMSKKPFGTCDAQLNARFTIVLKPYLFRILSEYAEWCNGNIPSFHPGDDSSILSSAIFFVKAS